MTKTAQTLTTDLFDEFTRDPRWAGWGYLGERQLFLEDGDDLELWPIGTRRGILATVDAKLVAYVNARGWSREDLFEWCNSKDGRHFADVAFDENPAGFEQAVGWDIIRKVAS